MRTVCSTGTTKILPSPICPVFAAATIRQEVHGVFGAAIDLGVTLLAAVTFDFGHGHALQAKLGEGLAHLIELEWLDDCHHQLHLINPSMFPAARFLAR
jgi:hypothetical protein